ncbi:hypothetical protein [Dysgonomonas sp. 25]|uniref:hypothetical protein n=1 Tax=Dysgonomonas sp. 25 TaxID=2302933 RepID=UPI0013D194FA|nr:hypothetical protein [Dysgonomonas sp. 25]NDV69409.1 hypothetical protein [Dysgonomonas sp. 25]
MRSSSQAILLIVIFFTAINSFAQVTIGSGNAPNAGALLDLKQHPDGSSNKGMVLPKVSLTDTDNLFPMFETSPGSGLANANYTGTLKDAEDARHAGLMVYNINDTGVDFCKGIYLWSGTEWARIPTPCAKAFFSTSSMLFYKSALAARNVTLDLSHNNASVLWTNDGIIPSADWQQYPSDITRGVSKIFTFQPKVNTTGGDRTTIVTATVKIDNKTYVHPITITQLDREMLYSLNTTTFAPQGTTHSVVATTEASDWSAALTSTNPGTMLSGLADNTNRPNSGTMRITLADNPTWAERIAKLNITSTDPHFKSREIDVKQTAAAPVLTRTSAGTISLASAQNVTFNTNAQWQFAVQSGNYAAVVGSASLSGTAITAGTTQGTTTPVTTRATSVTFNPSTSEPAPGNYTTTVRFSALNTSPQAAPAPFDVVMNRTVGARFTFNSLSATSIARAGGNITVNVSTNAAWKATPSIGTASANQNPSNFGNKSTTVNISPNTTWSITTSPVNRTITVSAVYGNNTSSMLTSGGSKTLTQPGYYISSASTNLSALSASAATNVNVSLAGAYPNMTNYIRAYNVTGSAALKTGTIAAGEYGTRSVTLSVPANATWNSRSVRMEYYHPGSASWKTVGSAVTQAGYNISGISRTIPTLAANAANNTSVTATGYFPQLNVRSGYYTTSASSVTALTTGTIAATTSGSKTSGNLSVPKNASWTTRNVVCQYQNPKNGNAWTTIGAAVSQAGYKVTAASATAVTSAAGGNCIVTLTGFRPNISVRALNTQSGTISGTVNGANSGNSSTTLAIPLNQSTTSTRTITIQYNNNGTWTNITSFTQDVGNFKLSTGRIVAKVDIRTAGQSIWNYAMGIPASYNTATYPHQNWLNYTQDYNTTQKTGCAAYSEPGYPAGAWRVPTEAEAIEMINNRGSIPAFDATSPHWTSTEKNYQSISIPLLNPNNAATNPTIVYYDEFYGNAARKKYLTLATRCVRYP